DEPTNGVDPVSRQEFWDILLQMRGTGMTIMVSTAYLDEGQRCDRVGLMHKSRLIAEDSPDRISAGYPNLEEAMIGLLMREDSGLAHDTFKR
ncbi:MAG TPA: ABC transporter ATP-binding protein, partial [Deltaproteobacteria bacterium]|nr:ABC transporter ATP-binding protein [Deltaproteobacteria bacterium]